MYKMIFSSRLKAALASRNTTQASLAQQLKTSQKNISNYVSGKSLPSVERLRDIASKLNVSTDWLLGISDISCHSNDLEIKQFESTINLLPPAKRQAVISMLHILAEDNDPFVVEVMSVRNS